METLSAIESALGIVEAFAPLVPEVISAVPTVVADAKKAATDVKALNAQSTIADVEGILSAFPSGLIAQVVTASKSIKL